MSRSGEYYLLQCRSSERSPCKFMCMFGIYRWNTISDEPVLQQINWASMKMTRSISLERKANQNVWNVKFRAPWLNQLHMEAWMHLLDQNVIRDGN